MKIFLLTEEFDRTVDVMGGYDSLEKACDAAVDLEKAQGSVTGLLEWRSLTCEDVQNPIDNVVSVAKRSSGGDFFVVRAFTLNEYRLGVRLATAQQLS